MNKYCLILLLTLLVFTKPFGAKGQNNGSKSKSVSEKEIMPYATIASTSMMELFIGIPNPISVAVVGIDKDKVKAYVSGSEDGKITGANGQYVVDVKSLGKVTITIVGEVEGGKQIV